MLRRLFFLLFFTMSPVVYAQSDGGAFGRLTQTEVGQLFAFAKESRYDLESDLRLTYAKDEAALGRVFAFSMHFQALDANARTYGQFVNNSFMILVEAMGLETYAAILSQQPLAVQQRIRDFLFYPTTQVPKKQRLSAEKTLRQIYSAVFPPGLCVRTAGSHIPAIDNTTSTGIKPRFGQTATVPPAVPRAFRVPGVWPGARRPRCPAPRGRDGRAG